MRYKRLLPFHQKSDPNTERVRLYLKKHTTIKRLSALALVLIMALFPAAPAMAYRSYQVRIYPNDQTATPTSASESRATRFQAYQIFQGEVDNEKYQPGDTPNYPPMDGELSEIKWGDSISSGTENYAALLSALAGIETPAGAVGVTAELLIHTEKCGVRYMTASALSGYSQEYNNPENWEPADGGAATEDDIGGRLTSEGDAKLRGILESAIPKLTLGDLFRASLEYEKYTFSDGTISPPASGNLAGSAEAIVSVLTDFTHPAIGNTALAQTFARVVTAKEDSGAYTYLNGSAYAASKWDSGSGCWTIGTDNAMNTPLQAGYYLILDTYTTHAAEDGYREDDSDNDMAQSEFIMAVFGTQNIFVKTKAPTVKKEIRNFDNGNAYGDDFEIGDTITFRITGTLAENFDNYDFYSYSFTDTLAEGLDYRENTMKVYAVAPNGRSYQLEPDENLTITYSADSKSVTIKFSDLKAVARDQLAADWNIVVEYQAMLNQSAEFENETGVYLTYSSSTVNSDSTSNTTKAVNYIYNFGVNIMKYTEAFVDDPITGDPQKRLADAGFALTKGDEYALFDENGNLNGWIGKKDLGGDSIDWAGITGGRLSGADRYVYFLTGEDGTLGVGGLKGLKADTDYTLREVIVPDGYDGPDEHTTIRFKAEYFDAGSEGTDSAEAEIPGKLKTLSYSLGGEEPYIENGGEPLVSLELINYPTEALLDTGGMGTALFYIGGGALLAGAALILIFSRVKKKRNEKHVRYVNTQK